MKVLDRFDLTGRVAVVTGASSGIGRSLAGALAEAGAEVVLVARRRELLEEASRDLNGHAIPADLSDASDIERLANELATLEPTILVNAAGINPRAPADELSLEAWQQTLDVNLRAPFLLAQALVPGMRKAGWGRILNIASLQSSLAFPQGMAYGASKGGLAQLTRAMARAWSPHGISANAIAPGFFPTELTASVFRDTEAAEALAARTAIGRNGRLEDLHGAAVFLCSSASDYVTGQILYVDGGFTAC